MLPFQVEKYKSTPNPYQLLQLVLLDKQLRSLVGVPLPVEEGVIGFLHVGNFKSHNFTERDVQQLQLIAHRLGLIIADARL
ncbi:GAF domain-containing protein [Nostoc muscorum FACHB-395]|nr:GAF domain-containing protein [Desmonostoc muscorum FACHB-395]